MVETNSLLSRLAARELGGLGHRNPDHRRRDASGDCRRAHQRARQPQVQTAGGRGQIRRSVGDRPSAGAPRRPRPRRLPAGPRPQRNAGPRQPAGPSGQEGQSPADDRLDRLSGNRGGAQAHPGQVDYQLHQPGGRRAIRAAAAGDRTEQTLRRGAGGRMYRRGQAAGTGDRNYIGSGVETIEGIRAIKAALPRCKTILGISNVSFGLPEAGREVLNSVMLYHCVQAGLDLAIVNSEKLERYPSVPEEERRLAEDLIWWRGDDPIAAFAGYFRARKSKPNVEQRRSLPLDERLGLYILEGSKEGLFEDLDEALSARSALEIINGPLMKGMDEVGRLFNSNQMIVAEVLQSAEAMKR